MSRNKPPETQDGKLSDSAKILPSDVVISDKFDIDISNHDGVPDIASMISWEEKVFLYQLACKHWTGIGAIVDAGTFLGASTACFSEGILHNRKFRDFTRRPIVYSYDRCSINKPMVSILSRAAPEAGIEIGGTFEPLLRQNVAPFGDIVELNIGDFLDFKWSRGNIEILFVDIAKKKELNHYLTTEFFPSLFDGSFIIQQDFFYEELPWIKVTMGRLFDDLEFVAGIHSTAAFRVRPGGMFKKTLAKVISRSVSADESIRAHKRMNELAVDRRRRVYMEMSLVRLLIQEDRGDAAKRQLHDTVSQFADVFSDNVGHVPPLAKLHKLEAMMGLVAGSVAQSVTPKEHVGSQPGIKLREARREMRNARVMLRQAVKEVRAAGGEPFRSAVGLQVEHLRNCKILPKREMTLDLLPKGATMLEVGTFTGRFAREIIARCEPKVLHIVDIDLSHFPKDEFSRQIAEGTIVLNEMRSQDYLAQRQDGEFDYIYIDGGHDFETVWADAQLASRKIKANGVLGFNDYVLWSQSGAVPYGVVQAVNKLCVEDEWEIRYFVLTASMFCDVMLTKIGVEPNLS